MTSLRNKLMHLIRATGWSVRRFFPDTCLADYLHVLFHNLDINCVLDVGGRHGQFGEFLRDNGYRGDIISFEPVAENYRLLNHRCSRDSRWTGYHYALGSDDTTREINVTESTSFSSFLLPNDWGRKTFLGSAVKKMETVTVRRLDGILGEVTAHIDRPRIYLKMDTQGWDLEVFRGARGCRDDIMVLQTELSVQPIYKSVIAWREAIMEFEQNGFAVSALFPVSRDRNLRLVETDCVMVRSPLTIT